MRKKGHASDGALTVAQVIAAAEDEWERRAGVARDDGGEPIATGIARGPDRPPTDGGDASAGSHDASSPSQHHPSVTNAKGTLLCRSTRSTPRVGNSSCKIRGRRVEHVDITCDGCETEPIEGARWRCLDCEDRDLCGACHRALCAARSDPGMVERLPPHVVAAVPCLKHTLRRVQGAERQLVLSLAPAVESFDDAASASSSEVCSFEAETARAVDALLADLPASSLRCEDVGWVVLERRDAKDDWRRKGVRIRDDDDESDDESASSDDPIDAAVEAWEKVLSSRTIKLSTSTLKREIDGIARRHGVLIGKWCAFPSDEREADALWTAVARGLATETSALAAAGCSAAKVSSRSPDRDGQVVCVYTRDYQNEGEVFAVRDALRGACGWPADRRMVYKPDIYTHLGIYAGNEFNLRPSIYADGGTRTPGG